MSAQAEYLLLATKELQDSVFREDDCACPISDLDGIFTYGAESDHVVFHLTRQERGDIRNGFSYAYNPKGHAGVSIFNRPVLGLLQSFQHPQTLAAAAARAGNTPEVQETVQRLAALELIEPVTPRPLPQSSQSDTLTAWLHITNDCNLRCSYCFVYKTPDPMELERGRSAVAAVFRSAHIHGFTRVKLKYAGGEATLNFAVVVATHQYAQKLAEQYGIALEGVVLSNGVALTGRMIEAMRQHDIRLMISLDGVGVHHDQQRPFVNGRGSFKQVEKTLDRLAAYNFTPSISITITNQNLAGLPEAVGYVLQRKLPFTLNFYRENDCSQGMETLAYQQEQIIAAMRAAFQVIEANLPPYSLLGALLDLTRLDTPHTHTCGVGRSYLVIDQHGGVAKCHMEIERTVTDVSVSDPLGLIMTDRIGIQNPAVTEKEGCRECTWRYVCTGGCPALTYRQTGRFDVKSPNCGIYKALFPEILRLEGLRLLQYRNNSMFT